MSISIDKKTEADIRAYAKKRKVEAPAALARLVQTAQARLAALAKYANKQRAPRKIGKKKGAKKASKNGKLKKAA